MTENFVRGFGSDNHSGIHPDIWQSLQACNQGHAPSYGTDLWSEKSLSLFKKEFGPKAEIFFVFNGTACNVLALRAMAKSFHSVLCADFSHLNVDECGAPEFFTGSKLISLPSTHGKLSLDGLKSALGRRGDQHFSQVKVISLTQPTEWGVCYSLAELKEICDWAHSEKLGVHMDGARLANAAYYLQTDFKSMTSDVGVDALSFGGTKNGLMMGEAVVFLNPALAEDFKYIRKQSAQLPSKTRFIAASFESYLQDGTWKKIAQHSCDMAEYFFQQLSQIPQVQITAPRQSNALFVLFPKNWIRPLREKYFFYIWNEKTFECRLMTSWDTQKRDIDGFVELAMALSQLPAKDLS